MGCDEGGGLMMWSLSLRLILGFLVGAFYALNFWFLMVVARMDSSTFQPNAIRCFVGAMVALIGAFGCRQGLKRLGLRTFQASLVLGFLAYVLCPLMAFQALRVLPSGVITLGFAALPIFVMVGYAVYRNRMAYVVLSLGALTAFVVGAQGEAALRGDPWSSLVILAGGIFSFSLAMWLTKKVFWLHSSWELCFWSLLMASGILFLLSAVAGEPVTAGKAWPPVYWAYLLLSSFGMAICMLAYRATVYRLGSGGNLVMTLTIPIVGLLLGYFSWEETPLNVLTLSSSAVILLSLVLNSKRVKSGLWLSHFLYNDMRKGDRINCRLDGYLRSNTTAGTGRVRVEDISIGGLGVLTDATPEVNQHVILDLPLSESGNQMTLECQVVHYHPNKGGEFPLFVGLVWLPMKAERAEDIVEFLAKAGRPEL